MPKKGIVVFFALLIYVLSYSFIPARGQGASRQVLLFNDNWRFHNGDPEDAQIKSFDDAGWRRVTLPHDWSIEGPYSKQWASATAYLPGGIGWYRKVFTLPAIDKDRKIYIQFNGVYKDSKVWVNGHFLGERPNGFISFRYDMTPYINSSGSNVIAVRVDHSKFADSRWYTGSGIYRNVYLIITHKLHLSQWGVSVASTAVSRKHAILNITVALTNETTKAQKMVLENILADGKGKIAARVATTVYIPAGKSDTIRTVMPVARPELWSTVHPQLYALQTLIKVAGKLIDGEATSVGIRSIRFDAGNGFFLNGVNLKLKGVCLHDDAGCLGVAVPSDVWKRRLKILKAAGCNAIRLSHNPHAPELYDLCDQAGFLLIDEAFDEWELGKHKWIKGWNTGKPGTDGYHEYFGQWADKDLRDMILRDLNHPSVIMWSIGNEIDYPNDPYSDRVLNQGPNPQIYGSGYLADHPSAENLGRIAKKLVKVVKEYDTTRPVTAALAAVAVSDKVGYPEALDAVGYNYQEYRYQEDHKNYPDRKIYGSENGMSYKAWEAVKNNDFVAGQFLWTGIDYLGEAGKWPSRGNDAGLVDLAGFKKPEYYFRQSIWTTKPMIYIGTARLENNQGNTSMWAHKKADRVWNYQQGDTVLVNCFTNCDEAELFLNSRSLGRKEMNDSTHIISWQVPYRPGKLVIKGYNRGRQVAAGQLQTFGLPAKLKVSADVTQLKPDGQSVAHITIYVADKNGTLIYNANNEITCSIQGPGKLLGLENGDNNSHESYTTNHRQAFHGKLLAYIQSSAGHSGEIRIMISAPGLGEQLLKIPCK